MALNFNVAPYFDDFDPTKNFHRILFKPGYAVQARELTQSQTILQNQISNFADNIFTQNTPVSGGNVTTNLNCFYIQLNYTYGTQTISAGNFLNKTIQDTTGTILAKVIATTEGATGGDNPTLVVTYLSGAHFIDGSIITPTDGTNFIASVTTSTTGNPSTGLSSTASISSGVFYVVNGYSQSSTQNSDGTYTKYSIGNFVQVNPQTVILNKYNNSPSYRVGLQINETIYDYINDSSLLDPAIGASNYQAPGADRYIVTLTLTSLPLTLGNDQSFIELLRIENGSIVKQVDGTVYSVIDDYFAKRDYETNGDYIVNDFKLTPSPNAGGNSNLYDLSVGKGIAYVHGYRIDNQSPQIITSDRARSVNTINNNSVFVDYGNYFVVDTVGGRFDIGIMPTVDFHCVPSSGIVTSNVATYSSTLVGSGFMRDLNFVTGTGSNTKSYVYNAFVSDIAYNNLSGNVASATTNTITINDPSDYFSVTANAYYNVTVSVTTGSIVDKRNIVSYVTTGGPKVITVDFPFTVTPTTSSTFTLFFQQYDVESIIKTVGSGSYALSANANINTASGKVNGLIAGDTIYNTGNPELLFQVGYPYVAQIANSSYYSTRIYRSKTFTGSTLTLLSTSGNSSSPIRFQGTGTLSGSVALQNFIIINTSTGNILDFSSAGNTISISSDRTTATITSSTYSGMTVDVIASVQINNADTANYVLKSKHLVTGNTSYASASWSTASGSTTQYNLTTGQTLIPKATVVAGGKIPLFVNDIKNIAKIYDSGSSSITPTGALSNYTDITNYFTLDNGQRDSYYDFGSISLIPGAPYPSGNILVVYNYYSHTQDTSGDGYFSIQSYNLASSTYGGVTTTAESYAQIPTYTAKDGTIYKLSDCIDFRPCRTNGSAVSSYTWEYSQAWSSTGDIGILLPNDLSNFQSNYSYYLGRQDILILTKDNSFKIIEGTPSVTPSLPTQPTGSLLLANLTLDPYTSYVPGEGPAGVTSNLSINKVIHKRWAKSDISDLETRVNNLEYYTSLSILEQNAQALQVPDSNGINRFKNGILVDNFSSYSTADTGNADYAANINIRQNQMSAIQVVNNFQLQNPVTLNSLGTVSNTNNYTINSIQGIQTNIFTLPYTTANVVVQPLASSTVSVNPFAVIVQQGVAQLNPPMDNWVDNTQAPPILITDPSMQVYQQSGGVNLINSGDFQTIPGTSSSVSSSVSVANHGAFNGPFGSTVGYTATTTSTYATGQQNITSSAYSPVSSIYGVNNGYLTNIAVLPYVRPQQIVVQASGLLVNTPITAVFDNKIVNQYMTTPNTIELTGVTGTFKAEDIIGFYISNNFYPIARVINVYNYPNGTQARLYVSDIIGAPTTVGSTTLQNGTFDVNGNYIVGSATASATVTPSSIISINMSGEIAGVGGTFSPTNAYSGATYSTTGNLVYAPTNGAYCSFLNQYGVWGDSNQSSSYQASFAFTATSTGTYTIQSSCDNYATVTITNTSSSVLATLSVSGYTSVYTGTVSLTSGQVYYVNWSATNLGGPASIGVVILDPSNTQVFASTSPPNLTYVNPGTQTIMPLGGAWFTGVTKVYLGPNASSISNYYAGSTINISSKNIYQQTIAATYTPPPPAPSGGGGSSYGCVVATTLADQNDGWSNRDMLRLMSWSFKKLDNSFLGKRLHRGYQVIGPKLLVPIVRKKGTLLSKYIKWSFTNATNMLQGKKFNPISILSTTPWIILMTTIGLIVTEEYATKSWQALGLRKK